MGTGTRASARAFVRSLNILLKFARLYEFGHVRTAAQFETTWKELRSALDESGGTGFGGGGRTGGGGNGDGGRGPKGGVSSMGVVLACFRIVKNNLMNKPMDI